jgi:hypothetical protein
MEILFLSTRKILPLVYNEEINVEWEYFWKQ